MADIPIKVVAIGGGTGLSTLLKGLKHFDQPGVFSAPGSTHDIFISASGKTASVIVNGADPILFSTRSIKKVLINAQDGKTLWTAPVAQAAGAAPAPGGAPGAPGAQPGGRRGGGRGGMGGGGGYGSIVDAGSVLMALTPRMQLIVFEPNDKELKRLASYKVADTPTYAYPIVSGNRVYIKDQDSVTLWTID